jgi:hypothetical protein
VFCLSNTGNADMPTLYLDSFERVWIKSVSIG